MTGRHLKAGLWLTLLALNFGCQHEAKDDSTSVRALEERISELEAKIEKLSQEPKQKTLRREPSQFVTLYKSNCSIQGCGDPAPLLAGLSSEKCKTIMDAEKKKSVAAIGKNSVAAKFGLSTEFRCDY